MRRESIKGKLAIPKEAWIVKAWAHKDFAAELAEVMAAIPRDYPVPIVKVLAALQSKHARLTEVFDEKAKETKIGRPKGPPKPKSTPIKLKALAFNIAYIPLGRPTKKGRLSNLQTYKDVEERRRNLAASNRTKSTIKAAIDSINRQLAESNGKQVGAAIKKNYQRVRAAYGRGKRLVES